MKKTKMVLALLPLLLVGGCTSSPQVGAIFTTMIKTALFWVPFFAGIIFLIFVMNKYILLPESPRTDNRKCAIIGVITFPVIFVLAFGWWFEWHWIAIAVGVIAGGVTGWFSYTLDEMMEEFWDEKKVTVPGAAGLIVGGWLVSLLFTSVWIEGNMFVTHKASAKRVIVERYCHTVVDGNDVYSWEYLYHRDKFDFGWLPPSMVDGVDYQLGYGYGGQLDRATQKTYYFLGGHFWSEDDQVWRDFRWLRLFNPNVHFTEGKVEIVQSNFYKEPIRNGGPGKGYGQPIPEPLESVSIPNSSDLPSPTALTEGLRRSFLFISILLKEHEYRSFLYFFFVLFGSEVLLFLFVPPLREPVAVFFLCSTVVALILMMVLASKSGGMKNLRLGSGRGGGFSGRSLSFGRRRRMGAY